MQAAQADAAARIAQLESALAAQLGEAAERVEPEELAPSSAVSDDVRRRAIAW